MIIPHIRDIFICGILGHYHKWLRILEKVFQKSVDFAWGLWYDNIRR